MRPHPNRMKDLRCRLVLNVFIARVLSVSAMMVLAGIGMGVTGCTPSIEELRAEGVEQYRSRRFVESMATMRYVMELDKSDAVANYYMGLNYRVLAERRFRDGDVPSARRQLDIALTYFTQAVKTWPNYLAAIDAKNEALEARGKFDTALVVAEGAASNNRGVAEHFLYLGNEYRERADYDNALRSYKKALAIDPNGARTYAAIGKLYLRVGDRDLARDAFCRAWELDPSEPTVGEALVELELQYDTYPARHEMPE